MSDNNIIQDFDQYYERAYSCWNDFFGLAERDLRFYLGDQWSSEEKRILFEQNRNQFVFNKIKRSIDMITGYQRKNRLSSIVSPQENSDQETADQLSQLLLYVMQSTEGYNLISDAFGGALKTGFNMISLWMDYREDPVNGDIKMRREPFNGFITDPYFTNFDLSDCEYILRRKYLNYPQVLSLIPSKKKEITRLYEMGYSRDDKFTWLPYQRNPGGQEMMAYDEFYRQKWKSVPILIDQETGEMMDFDLPKEEIDVFLKTYPQLKIIEKQVRQIELVTIVNREVLSIEINPFGLDEYPFMPFVCVWEPESDQWSLKVQSLTRFMIDPQRESNQRRSQMVDILDSQINSGWIANENSVINPQSLFQTSQGKVIWRRENAVPGSVEKIQPAQIPPAMFQLQEIYDRDLMEIAGLNDAAFGQAEMANDSGVMMQLRQGAAINNLQTVFDNLRLSQKGISKKIIKLIQQWTPSKIQRIINQSPTQEFYNKEFTKYDVVIQEGLLTDTQRQIYFRQLIDLKQLGAPISGEMLAKAAPIQGGSQLQKQVAAMEQQQAQQAQQAQQIQMQQIEAQSLALKAQTINSLSMASEREGRKQSDLALATERISESEENRATAALNRAKTITEIADLNDDRILKVFEFVNLLNRQEIEDREAIALKVSAQSEKIDQDIKQQIEQPLGVQQTPNQGQNLGV